MIATKATHDAAMAAAFGEGRRHADATVAERRPRLVFHAEPESDGDICPRCSAPALVTYHAAIWREWKDSDGAPVGIRVAACPVGHWQRNEQTWRGSVR